MKPVSQHPQATISIISVFFIIVLIFMFDLSHSEAQIVSHELRRLAVSTNQFGIDALKALDRIEPPDKVLVFCPVCLSSSLMMIMMGSSKYQVVSSFRHALYVWSMKPHEINQAFRDIFEHIGLNQQQQNLKSPQTSRTTSTRSTRTTRGAHEYTNQVIDLDELPISPQINRAARDKSIYQTRSDITELPFSSAGKHLSLPKLIKMKELLESSSNDQPWWLSQGRKKAANDFRELGERLLKQSSLKHSSGNTTQISDEDRTRFDYRGMPDTSQMSAISNIYIQRGLAMNYNYNLLLRQYYKTVIHPVDFIRNGEETRQHINSLVSANTEGKIKDLVKKGTFERKTSPKIMIITTFHFRGTLDIQMKNKDALTTQISKFRSQKSLSRSPRSTNRTVALDKVDRQPTTRAPIFIQTEESLLKYGHFSELGCSVVEIPFSNRLVSLIIVMPNHSNMTELMLTKLSAQVLSDMIGSLTVKKLSIEIPVIKFDRGPINVEGLVRELGLDTSFFGDKIHTSETGLNKWMRPSDIVHETSIDIGTINPNWIQTEDRLKVGAHDTRSSDDSRANNASSSNHIKLDKPFFYFVLDSINSLVLTMGRIRQ